MKRHATKTGMALTWNPGSLLATGVAVALLSLLAASAAVAAPILTKPGNTPVGQGKVGVGAYVNPQNAAVTECRVEFGLTTGYGQGASCQALPPANDEPNLVTAQLSGLTPGATYHYRLVIVSDAGTSQSDDGLIRVSAPAQPSCDNVGFPGAAQLPDCRVWELVSPPSKNGGEAIGQAGRTQAAADDPAVRFASLAGFADTEGSSVATEYVAQRSSQADPGHNGWSVHGITPLHPAIPLAGAAGGLETSYKLVSPDLDRGAVLAFSPLTGDPAAATSVNLYTRSDLLLAGPSSYQLLTGCPLCTQEGTTLPTLPDLGSGPAAAQAPYLAGASPDLDKVVFESPYRRTSDAPTQSGFCDFNTLFSVIFCAQRLYEWDNGIVRLAGILPDGTPADASIAGAGTHEGNYLTRNTVSDGGDGHSRIVFTQPTNSDGQTISEAPSDHSIASSHVGNVFVREDQATTAHANASERTAPTAFQPAHFEAASVAGDRIFFTTKQELTDNAPNENIVKLYMYDASKPAADPENLTLIGADGEPLDGIGASVQGVVGTSNDGRYVYFTTGGEKLIEGQPTRSGYFYLWHDGELTEITGALAHGALYENLRGQNWRLNPTQSRVTPDGENLLFTTGSWEGLLSAYGGTDYDQSNCFTTEFGAGCRELYLYNAETNSLQCASCNPSGDPAPKMDSDVMASAIVRGVHSGGAISITHDNSPLSDDGRYVFFHSGERLVASDTNGKVDAYVYDSTTGRPTLLSSGESATNSYFLDASSSNGASAFILTQERLSRWDIDELYDVYAVQKDGGFPEPPLPPATCQGDACQPPPLALNDPTPASSSFDGPGNPREALRSRCGKGQRRVRTRSGKSRCVKKQNTGKRRIANTDRRSSR